MAWSPKQIRLAHMAARAAEWNDFQRRTVLGGFDGRARMAVKLTSKSSGLTNADFERYMATAEAECDGQLPGFGALYWAGQANTGGNRQPRLIDQLIATLQLTTDADTGHRVIGENLEGLAGIVSQATSGRATAINQLSNYDQHSVIVALKALVKRHNEKAAAGR